MAPRNSSKAIAILTALSVIASLAVLALATAGTTDAQAQGCTGGGASPSPSASGGSSQPSGLPTGLPSGIPSLIPGSSTPSPSSSPSPSTSPTQSSAPAPRDQMIPVAQPSGETTCSSTISIKYRSSGRKGFIGNVKSEENLCEKGRRVQVKKMKKGKDATVGRAVTNNKGAYTVLSNKSNGRFYAKVAKSTVENDDGQTITCKAAQSKTIRP